MFRPLLALVLTALVAGCVSTGPVVEETETPPPAYRYSFVVDGYLERTLELPAGTEQISVVVQPRSGESAIWQVYEATYAHIVLEPSEGSSTAKGGRELEISGTVEFYRDLKVARTNGQDEVVRGNPIDSVDVESKRLVVEPDAPAMLEVAEGLYVEIAVVPPKQQP